MSSKVTKVQWAVSVDSDGTILMGSLSSDRLQAARAVLPSVREGEAEARLSKMGMRLIRCVSQVAPVGSFEDVDDLIARAAYWKQRALSAEGNITGGDTIAMGEAMQAKADELKRQGRKPSAQILAVTAALEMSRRRELRRPLKTRRMHRPSAPAPASSPPAADEVIADLMRRYPFAYDAKAYTTTGVIGGELYSDLIGVSFSFPGCTSAAHFAPDMGRVVVADCDKLAWQQLTGGQ